MSASIKTVTGELKIDHVYAEYFSDLLKDVTCVDIVPDINIKVKGDMDILRTWMKHFESVRSPYIIEQVGNKLALWKEQRA